MELLEYKQKRDERIRLYCKNGYEITYMQEAFAIDEKLVRSIIGSIKPATSKYVAKSLKIDDPDWN